MNPTTKHKKLLFWGSILTLIVCVNSPAEKTTKPASLGAPAAGEAAKPATAAPAASAATTAAPAKAEGEKAAATPATKTAEAGAATEKPAAEATADNQSIRKLISSQPDPSLVLEPEETPEAKPKNAKPRKGPPSRPVASLPGGNPGGTALGKPGARFGGRLPSEVPTSPEVAIILVNNQFYPSRIRLKEGNQTRLYLTTTNEKPAAVVVEQLQIQRWIAKEGGAKKPQNEMERARMEVTREVTKNRVTEILIDPIRGTYSFHDVISGARGQIIVE